MVGVPLAGTLWRGTNLSLGLGHKLEENYMTFDAETIYTALHAHFRERVRRNEPLVRHCTFGVGGPADVWVSLDTQDDLVRLVRLSAERHWPLLVVGNGTNVLYA